MNYFPGDDLFTPGERRRGIPIGNQTSQFFANVYLDPLDHFVKDRLGIKGYVRYVDDFLVFSDDKRHLADVREQIRDFLVGLRLRLHPTKSVIFPVKEGIRFLGYRVFPTHRLLPKENVRRFRRRVRRDAGGLCGGPGFLCGNPPAAHELDRPRPASEHLSAALPIFSIQSASRGRRPSSRVLRGGSFNNQASNVRSANRNNNVPTNRNNNNGFRPASTLPCRNPQGFILRSVPGCKVQVVVPCRAVVGRLGQMKSWPGRSGRPQGSKALPGLFVP